MVENRKFNDDEKRIFIEGMLREGKKEYGDTYTGFIGEDVLKEMINKNDYGDTFEEFETLIEYLGNENYYITDDMVDELSYYDNDLDTFLESESPFDDFTSSYIYDRYIGKVEFFCDDDTSWIEVIIKYKELEKTGKLIVIYNCDLIVPTVGLGDLSTIIPNYKDMDLKELYEKRIKYYTYLSEIMDNIDIRKPNILKSLEMYEKKFRGMTNGK